LFAITPTGFFSSEGFLALVGVMEPLSRFSEDLLAGVMTGSGGLGGD
jgi:hypothetical protein